MGTLSDSFKTPEIRKKILFTFLILSVLSLLTIVPIPGLNHAVAVAKIADWGDMGRIINILSGRALANASIISLGIYPFLVASIIMQFVVLLVPKLRSLSQMGDEGTKLITKINRIAALIAAGVYAVLYCVGMAGAVTTRINFWVGIVLCGVAVAVGSAFCGWCVELLNNKGIGNGLTIIVVAGVVRSIPEEIYGLYHQSTVLGRLPAVFLVGMGCLFCIGVLFLVILLNLGEKKLRIIFSKRTVGMKQYGMQNQVLPFKVTQAGTTPVIYTLVILLIPSVIVAMVVPGTDSAVAEWFKNFVEKVAFLPLFIVLIVMFTNLFSLMQFNPFDISKQIKENGGYIQGLRPGKPTAQYLMNVYRNLNIVDCVYLILICIIPMIVNYFPAFRGVCLGGIGIALVGGGFIEMKAILDNSLKTEQEKAKAAGKEKKRKNYTKK